MTRRSAVVGVAALTAVALYVSANVLGGVLDPTYSHVSDSVSGLTSSHAPDRRVLGLGFAAYNVAVAVTALALLRAGLGSRALTAGVSLLLVTTTACVLMPRWHGLARLSRYVGAALLVAAREPQRSGAGG